MDSILDLYVLPVSTWWCLLGNVNQRLKVVLRTLTALSVQLAGMLQLSTQETTPL